MSSTPFPTADCGFETPVVAQPRKRAHGSVTNVHSHKRRRISMASADLARELEIGSTASNENLPGTSADRFVPLRPKTFLPLNITPRTKRISKQFGLTDERIFSFRDENDGGASSSSSFDNTLNLLRKSASTLFRTPPAARSTSVTENLTKRRQCLLTLDSPGVPKDAHAFPISWSRQNFIAVSCGKDVFYQDLKTKQVSHMFKLDPSGGGYIHAIDWAEEEHESYLAAGNLGGTIQVWDAGKGGSPGTLVRMWREKEDQWVKSLAWSRHVLAVGADDGAISLFDVRAANACNRTRQHRDPIAAVKWSIDGNYMASGDEQGIVHVWDKRAGKSLLDLGKRNPKMRHRAAVKALAWCPWKPDLLATGSCAPEGKIRIWSTSGTSTPCPEPVEIYPLNTSVYSLQWSPHCKELLSTHGSSFAPTLSRRRSLSNLQNASELPEIVKTVTSPLTNSIAVHDYPSGKRLLTLTNAHSSPVTHSCLSPDGEGVFTVSPNEETIKMWQVWGKRLTVEKRESAFDRCAIR